MPLSVRDGALLGGGLLMASGATLFYRRKQTLPFKVAYFLTWPVLGSAIILLGTPSNEKMAKEMKESGLVTEETLEQQTQLRQLQMQKIREAARHPDSIT